jgi:peptidyl-prolyl cis-trans isomerase SurA
VKKHSLTSLLVGALALLTLSACAGLHPGVAATVGDETIATSEVDDVTRISCDLGGSAPQPRSAVMRDIVNALVTTRVDTQYAESVGATYDKSQLQQRVQQLEDSLTKLSDADRDTYVQVVSDFLRSQLMLADVGAKSLKKKGAANPAVDESVNEGSKLSAAWAKKNLDVEIDPRYNPGTSGKAGGGDGSISRPVSPYAKSAAGTAKPDFVSALPAELRCG